MRMAWTVEGDLVSGLFPDFRLLVPPVDFCTFPITFNQVPSLVSLALMVSNTNLISTGTLDGEALIG